MLVFIKNQSKTSEEVLRSPHSLSMKKSLLLSVFCVVSLSLFARDFTFGYQGSVLTYYVKDEAAKTCGVAKNASASGEVQIPRIAKDGNTQYTVVEVGREAFQNCINLTSVTLPTTVNAIGDGAFQYCKKLVTVNIPNGVADIPGYTFEYCLALSSISLPATMNHVGYKAFSYCKSLSQIYCQATVPPVCVAEAFQYVRNCTLYVPEKSVAAYKSADLWKDLSSIQGYDFTNLEETTASATTNEVAYDLMGRRVSNPTHGLYIINGRKVRRN